MSIVQLCDVLHRQVESCAEAHVVLQIALIASLYEHPPVPSQLPFSPQTPVTEALGQMAFGSGISASTCLHPPSPSQTLHDPQSLS